MNTETRTGHIALAVVSPEAFREALGAARDLMPAEHAACVTPYTARELRDRGAMCLLTGDEQAGFAVARDGELLGLFNVGPEGRGPLLLRAALEHGATWLGCFDGYLPSLYEGAGFVVVGRTPFDPALAPANINGTPDYVTMRVVS